MILQLHYSLLKKKLVEARNIKISQLQSNSEEVKDASERESAAMLKLTGNSNMRETSSFPRGRRTFFLFFRWKKCRPHTVDVVFSAGADEVFFLITVSLAATL